MPELIPAEPAKQAEIDPRTFQQWADFKRAAAVNEANARKFEIEMREQAGEAGEYTVDGELVARRVISDAGDRIECVEAGHA